MLRVQRGREMPFEAAVGSPGRPDAVWDLASLTKPLAATTVLMTLAAEGRLSPSDPLARFVPEAAGTDKAALTLASLLDHSAGLPWWRDYARAARRALGPGCGGTPAAREEVLRRVLAEPLTHAPGTKAVYSDLGFMLLDRVIEAAAGVPPDAAFAARVAAPLGLSRTAFRPPPDWDLVPTSRTARLRGLVHDGNARVLGGVAGHAGLFGTAAEVASILAALHAAWAGSRAGPFWPEVVRRFLARSEVPGSTRTLGFDTPSASGSLAGDRHPPRLVGHTGFTGTMFWLDLDSGTSLVLLTNRVLLGAARAPIPRLNDVRRAVCDAVWDAVG